VAAKNQRWFRELQSDFPGLKLGVDGKGRTGHGVLTVDGKVLRQASGLPFSIPSSPSDQRALANTRAQLRRVLEVK
jgi:hypothetical protein